MNEYLIPAMRGNPKSYFVPQIKRQGQVESWIMRPWTRKRWLRPASNWCAMCCLRSLLLGLDRRAPPLLELYARAFEAQVYRRVEGKVVGAYHVTLASFIMLEFGLSSTAERNLSLSDIARYLAEGNAVFASVSPAIRHLVGGYPPPNPSGHFVFVYGFCDEGIILHNSTGFSRLNTQSHVVVSWARFAECFSGRAVIVRL